MKKLLKIIFGILLILGCSGGVLLDNSGMFVRNAWAREYSLDGRTKVTGETVEQISCMLDAEGKKKVFVIVDSDYFSVDNYSGSDSCSTIISNIKKEMGDKGFNVEKVIVVAKTDGDTPGESGDGSGGPGGEHSASTVGSTGAPKMNVLNMCKDEEGEEAIKCVLRLVVTVMTYGIGVLGVVGIVLSGIQYITSQGDPAKMAKAKNRIIHVIIGLVVYAVMYAALVFLVPGFNPGL